MAPALSIAAMSARRTDMSNPARALIANRRSVCSLMRMVSAAPGSREPIADLPPQQKGKNLVRLSENRVPCIRQENDFCTRGMFRQSAARLCGVQQHVAAPDDRQHGHLETL